MILRPEQIRLMRLGLPVVPCNGLGDSGSTSSNSSSTTTQNFDKRVAVETGVGLSSDSSTVTVNALDGGAILASLDFAKLAAQGNADASQKALAFASDVFENGLHILDFAGKQVESQTALVSKAYDNAQGTGTEKTYLLYAALAAVAVVALANFAGKK